MANPTTSIIQAEDDSASKAKAQLEQAYAENAEGIVQALGLLQALEERGVLPLTRALVEQGDDVLKIILALVTKEEYMGGIKNLIALVQGLTAIPNESMQSIVAGFQGGIDEASHTPSAEKFGVYDILKALQDPDVSRAISHGMAFLKGMGRAIGAAQADGGDA